MTQFDFVLVHFMIGRTEEIKTALACAKLGRHLIFEGPVGTGKSTLAHHIAEVLNRPIYRIDGDGRYSEQQMIGYFDPPLVLKNGYLPDYFIYGPLSKAMNEGGILLINELNRIPESTLNVLLPVLDEDLLIIPKLGHIQAQTGFLCICTQNTSDHIGANLLSEAIQDRTERVQITYQSQSEEYEIVALKSRNSPGQELIRKSVDLVRSTREDARFVRGASVRAAIAIAELSVELGFNKAVQIALPSRCKIKEKTQWPELLSDLEKKSDAHQ